jgi:hypothetical protein
LIGLLSVAFSRQREVCCIHRCKQSDKDLQGELVLSAEPRCADIGARRECAADRPAQAAEPAHEDRISLCQGGRLAVDDELVMPLLGDALQPPMVPARRC